MDEIEHMNVIYRHGKLFGKADFLAERTIHLGK